VHGDSEEGKYLTMFESYVQPPTTPRSRSPGLPCMPKEIVSDGGQTHEQPLQASRCTGRSFPYSSSMVLS
jgi:hypothetical protein